MAAVPASDLPNNSVPSGDLPDHLKTLPDPQKKSGFGGAVKAGAKAFGEEAIKVGSATTGAEGGAALGAMLGGLTGPLAPVASPVLGLAGGLTGGVIGYEAPGYLQRHFPKTFGAIGFDPDTRAKEESEHPTASLVGRLPTDIYGAGQAARGLYTLGKEIPGIATAVTKGAKAVLGVPSRSTEQLARDFEKKGFKLEPAQLKADTPSKSPGFMGNRVSNQKLANKLASETTGQAAGEGGITADYLDKRFEALGKKYDAIIDKQPHWTLDATTKQQLADIVAQETDVPAGQVRPVMKAAKAVLDKYMGFDGAAMDAAELKRTMSELKRIARTARDGQDKYTASEAINAITGSLQRNHPDIAQELKLTNQQYRSTVALSDLYDAKGIQGGNISLAKLGDRLKYLGGNPLYELGHGGRELNIAARWEGAGPLRSISAEHLLSPSKLARAVGTLTATRSQKARAVQRAFKGD